MQYKTHEGLITDLKSTKFNFSFVFVMWVQRYETDLKMGSETVRHHL